MAPQEPIAPPVPTKVCSNCGVQSQTTADKCPSCGNKYKKNRVSRPGIVIVILAWIVIFAVYKSQQ